MIGPSFSDL